MPISTNAFPFINLGFIGCQSWARPLTKPLEIPSPKMFMSLWEFIIYQEQTDKYNGYKTTCSTEGMKKGSWQWEHRAREASQG